MSDTTQLCALRDAADADHDSIARFVKYLRDCAIAALEAAEEPATDRPATMADLIALAESGLDGARHSGEHEGPWLRALEQLRALTSEPPAKCAGFVCPLCRPGRGGEPNAGCKHTDADPQLRCCRGIPLPACGLPYDQHEQQPAPIATRLVPDERSASGQRVECVQVPDVPSPPTLAPLPEACPNCGHVRKE